LIPSFKEEPGRKINPVSREKPPVVNFKLGHIEAELFFFAL
jgi:hypothetical protein